VRVQGINWWGFDAWVRPWLCLSDERVAPLAAGLVCDPDADAMPFQVESNITVTDDIVPVVEVAGTTSTVSHVRATPLVLRATASLAMCVGV